MKMQLITSTINEGNPLRKNVENLEVEKEEFDALAAEIAQIKKQMIK
jgi:hypothetical protein